MTERQWLIPAALVAILAFAGPTFAQEKGSIYGYGVGEREDLQEPEYSPFLDVGYPQRPLDVRVVADPAENQGLAPMLEERNPDLHKLDFGKQHAQLVYDGNYGDA